MCASSSGKVAHGDTLRVIVADDHEWIRQILVQVVRQTLPEAQVIETLDGLQAFEAYQQGGADFLVTNHSMPRMDGPTLTRQVRKQAPELPILMVSAQAEARKDAVEAGANWFLPKDQIMAEMPKLLLACQPCKSRTGEPLSGPCAS